MNYDIMSLSSNLKSCYLYFFTRIVDTSSKELMGLLEKHLNELQSKPSSKDKKESEDADEEKSKESKPSTKKQSSAGSTSSSKAKSGGKKTTKGEEKSAAMELSPQASSTITGFVRTLPITTEQKETPAMDMKESDALKRAQETVPAAATGEKKQILPKASIETPVDEPTYEVSEPGAVKSILARAKEVLKSLDDEKDEDSGSDDAKRAIEDQSTSSKKSDITRKSSEEDAGKDTESKAVKQIAKLAANLAKTASKNKNGKTKVNDKKVQNDAASTGRLGSQFSNEKKPKPGPKKSGLSATGPGRAGMGNTP